MTKKLFYSHEMMLGDLAKIHRELHKNGIVPDVVYGITRGGLIPAVHSSHYFGVPMETVKVSTYDGSEYGDCSSIVNDLRGGKMVLLVDDICDTGNTLKYIASQVDSFNLDNLVVVTLIHNQGQNNFIPDYYGLEINKVEEPCWVVFPWEQD